MIAPKHNQSVIRQPIFFQAFWSTSPAILSINVMLS